MSLTLALRQAILYCYLAAKIVFHEYQQISFVSVADDARRSRLFTGNLRGGGNGILQAVGKQRTKFGLGR